MKKILMVILILGLAVFFSVPAHAVMYTFDALSDPSQTIGNFKVSTNNVASGTGQNYEVLKFQTKEVGTKPPKTLVGTAFDGSPANGIITVADQGPHFDVKMGPLWTTLNDYGITNAYKLVFGFDVNQAGSSAMDITALTIDFKDGNIFSLGSNVIRVNEYNGNGSSLAELKFEVALPYNFMTTYNALSTNDFYIEATHNNETGGFDEYFLSAVFTCASNGGCTQLPPPPPTVPEPASMFLLGSGLLGFAGIRRKRS